MINVEKLVCGIVVWLHIKAGVSRSVATSVLQAIRCLVTIIFTLLAAALAGHGITLKVPRIGIPHDIRTAYRCYFTEPKCTRVVCCPKCFKTFTCPQANIPLTCPWKASPRARVCGANLWKRRRTRKGIKFVPVCWYTTQEPEPWFEFFLGRKEIDNALMETFRKQTGPPPAVGTGTHDVQDSPAFRNLFQDQPSPYNLIFGIYIDFFQVFGMKTAGEFH